MIKTKSLEAKNHMMTCTLREHHSCPGLCFYLMWLGKVS